MNGNLIINISSLFVILFIIPSINSITNSGSPCIDYTYNGGAWPG